MFTILLILRACRLWCDPAVTRCSGRNCSLILHWCWQPGHEACAAVSGTRLIVAVHSPYGIDAVGGTAGQTLAHRSRARDEPPGTRARGDRAPRRLRRLVLAGSRERPRADGGRSNADARRRRRTSHQAPHEQAAPSLMQLRWTEEAAN